ncbi:MAG: hypothetical protein IKK85_07375 [Clostridia bacterium]|nr:hypothetical protein [Clostridia bacterium]
MKNLKNVVCFLLIVFMAVTSITTNVSAYSEEKPLLITAETNKNSYGAISTANITVIIENISDKTIKDINVCSAFEETSPIGRVAPYIVAVELKPGEKAGFTYQATIKPEKLNFFMSFILKIKRLFSGTPRFLDVDAIEPINSTNITISFGGEEISEEIYVWSTDLSNVYLEPNNKNEAINNEKMRHQKALEDIENQYNSNIYLIDIRKEALIEQTGVRYPLSAEYYQEKIDELNVEINELQRRINALQYDTSAAGVRKRLEYIAEQEELIEKRREYSELMATSIMFEQLDKERAAAKVNRDTAITKENELHQNNLAKIELEY